MIDMMDSLLRTCSAVILLCGLFLGTFISAAFSESLESKPWLKTYEPKAFEWFVLELQATEGDQEIGENGFAVHFYSSKDTVSSGVIEVDIEFDQTVSATLIEKLIGNIRKRFEANSKTRFPWAKLRFHRRSLSSDH